MNFVIPVNRGRVPGALLFWSAVTVGWVVLMVTQDFGSMYTILFGISLVMLLVRVALLLADYGKTLFDGRAQLIISSDGIEDKRSIFSCGRIPWSDVTAIELYQERRMKVLVVRLINAEAVLAAQPWWKRVFQREMSKRFGSPVLVSQSSVKYDLTVLHAELDRLLRK